MRFVFMDKVEVISGFYRGQWGVVNEVRENWAEVEDVGNLTSYEYFIKLDQGKCVWIEEENLKLKKK